MLGLLRQALAGWDALEAGAWDGGFWAAAALPLGSGLSCGSADSAAPAPSRNPRPTWPPADLAELSPDIARQLAPAGAGRTVAQAVVDAVVALLQPGAFGSPSPGHPAGSPAAAAGETAAETAALQFLAAHLASNRSVVSGSVLLRVLQHLAAPGGGAAGSAPGSTPGSVPSSAAMLEDEREAVFCDIVSAAGSSMGPPDHQQAMFLARQAGFLRAEARVLHAEGNHAAALACLARDERYVATAAACQQQRPGEVGLLLTRAPLTSWPCRHPAAAFKYVRDVLSDLAAPLAPPQRAAFTAAVLAQAPQLLALNAAAASQVNLGQRWNAGALLLRACACACGCAAAAAAAALSQLSCN